jgi:hypothetical protein
MCYYILNCEFAIITVNCETSEIIFLENLILAFLIQCKKPCRCPVQVQVQAV